jgi:hypothetical protein
MSAPKLQIYSGQDCVGEIEIHGRRKVVAFRLKGARRIKVGTYATRLEAMRAVTMPSASMADERQ